MIIFDMMFYNFSVFYQRFFRKKSWWEGQAISVVGITKFVLFIDIIILYITFQGKIEGEASKVVDFVILLFIVISLIITSKRYSGKFSYYKKKWGIYTGWKKHFFMFLSFFIVIFLWCFVFIANFLKNILNG